MAEAVINGTAFEVITDFNDLEILDTIMEIEEGRVQYVGKALRMVFGDGHKAVYEAIRGDDGKVTIEAGAMALHAAIEAANRKNS